MGDSGIRGYECSGYECSGCTNRWQRANDEIKVNLDPNRDARYALSVPTMRRIFS
jgi:hypothetical protein